MKILLLGDASNYHASLASGLSALGHDVTLASNGSRWMQTARQIDLSRKSGKLGGAWLWVRLNTLLASDLRGYDVVQLCSPGFVDLRPKRLRTLFDRLRRDNGHVALTMLGFDSKWIKAMVDCNAGLDYSEFSVGGRATPYAEQAKDEIGRWLAPELADYTDYVYDCSEAVVTVLYEYQKGCSLYVPERKLHYAGIPIVLPPTPPTNALAADGKLRIMAACHAGREAEKGMDAMLPVLRRFAQRNASKVKLDLVQNVPFAQFKALLAEANVVVDQLYSYTPATSALMAMAQGKAVVSGAEPEYYDFISEASLRPIINADPRDLGQLERDLQALVDNPNRLAAIGQQGRQFVEKHNAAPLVAKRFVEAWEKM